MSTSVLLHPEATADPLTVRWVIAPGTLPVRGEIAEVPGRLGELCTRGCLRSIAVESAAVLIRLMPGHSWWHEGAEVRDALTEALAHPGQWRPVHRTHADDLLRTAVQEVLDGAAGDYIRSHGGEVRVVTATQGEVVVQMGGACSHCPALGLTLHARLEAEVRSRYPDLRDLRAADPPRPTGALRRLTSFVSTPRPRPGRSSASGGAPR